MKAASIMAAAQRPLLTSHPRSANTRPVSASNDQRPALMSVRGSALRIQPPILTADTNNESASVPYATMVKSMRGYPPAARSR